MSAGVGVVDRIIAAVAILVQTIDGFGIQVIGAVGRDEAAPFGGIVPGVAVIQAGFFVVVVTTITNGVSGGNSDVGSFTRDGAVAPYLYFTMICASSQEKAGPQMRASPFFCTSVTFAYDDWLRVLYSRHIPCSRSY